MALSAQSERSSAIKHRFAAASSPITVRARPAYLRPVPDAPSQNDISTELERMATVVTAVRGRMLIEEGDSAEHVFKVVSGALRAVRLLPDGRRYVTKFLLPGDYFGFTEGPAYGQTVEAVGDATLARYPRARFDALLASDPGAGRRFLGVICNELVAAQDRLLLMGRKSAMERMTTFLLGMADHGCRAAAGDVHLPMNRTDVADYLGLTVETVSRLLTQLRSDGVIDLPTPNHVVFCKREVLEEISRGAI